MGSFTRQTTTTTLTVRVPTSIVNRITALRKKAAAAGYKISLNEIWAREIERTVTRLEKEAADLRPVASNGSDSGEQS
jgi:predicted ABC-type ATPase